MPLHFTVTNAIETLDASIFSTDDFINGENIQLLQAKLDRWNRGLSEHRATLKEILKDAEALPKDNS